MNIKEKIFKWKNLNQVLCAKFDPEGAGFLNLYLVPTKFSLKSRSSIAILNSREFIPLAPAWTVLVANFIFEISHYREEINNQELEKVMERAVNRTHKIYPTVKREQIKEDLEKIITVFKDVAYHKQSDVNVGQVNLATYSKFMKGPLKVNLILTPFLPSSSRLNNASCIYCSTKLEDLPEFEELTVEDYKKIMNILKKNCVPQIVFNGDNILDRKEDLLELLEYGKRDFITSIKVKGARLTKELCEEFVKRGLDELVITLYSWDKEIHNLLSNEENFDKVVQGIKNAKEAGINVVIDTPVCTINQDYLKTLTFLNELGIKYVICRLLNVKKCSNKTEQMRILSKEEIVTMLEEIKDFIRENKIETIFATHNYVPIETLKKLGIGHKLCRACVNEITINVFGDVVPCYNCVNTDKILGNILKDDWHKIWKGPLASKIREGALSKKVRCPSSRTKE